MLLYPLAAIGRRAPVLLAGGVFAGLLVPDLATALRPALGPLVALLLAGSLLRLEWGELRAALGRPGRVLWVMGWQLVLAPVLVWGLTLVLGLPAGLSQALILNAAAPSLVGSVAIAQLSGLDAALIATLVVATTFVLPLTVTPVLALLLGLDLGLDLGAFYLRFGLYVVLPALAAALLRRLLGPARIEARRFEIDGLNVVLLVLAALAMMAGVTARLLGEPLVVAGFLAATVCFNFALQAMGALAFRGRGPHGALSAGLAIGNRNTALMLVLLGGQLDGDLALYVAMAQIPIYLMPLLARPIYAKLLPRSGV